MKKMFVFLLLSVFLFPQNNTGNIIRGKVYKNSNTVAPGATVIAHGFGPSVTDSLIFTTTSNNTGSYAFESLPAGMYYIKASFQGLVSQAAGPFTVSLNTVINEVHLFLAGSAVYANRVSGRVLNSASGTGIPFAQVKLLGNTAGTGYVATAALNGSYVFENIVPGSYLLQASAAGYISSSLLAYISIGPNTNLDSLNIALQPQTTTGIMVSGKTLSTNSPATASGLPGVKVMLKRNSNNSDSLMYSVFSDSAGRFIFASIASGTYTLTASKEGYITKVMPNLQLFQNTDNIMVYLEPVSPVLTAMLKGKVLYDVVQTPVAGVRIDFMPLNGPSVTNALTTYTGIDGRYTMSLPAGSYVVSATHASSAGVVYKEYYDNKLNIADADIIQLQANQIKEGVNFGIPNVLNPPTVLIKGKVTDTLGMPLGEANVTLWIAGDSLNIPTFTGNDGRYMFSLTNHPASSVAYRVSARKNGYKVEFYNNKPTFAQADIITIAGDTIISDINFSLERAANTTLNRISGSVYTQGDSTALQTPLALAIVLAIRSPQSEVLVTFTGSDGGYSFENVPAGGYYLLYVAPGYIPEFYNNAMMWEDATLVNASGNVTGIDAVLSPVVVSTNPGIVAGVVKDGSNNPLSEVYVSILDQAGRVIGYSLTNAQGAYSISGLTAGIYTVQASKVEYNSYSAQMQFDPNAGLTNMMNVTLFSTLTSAEENTAQPPVDFTLYQNFPNPFNPSTTIRFSIPVASRVDVMIYNALGVLVQSLGGGEFSSGENSIRFEAENLSSGIYYYRVSAGSQQLSGKMMLLK